MDVQELEYNADFRVKFASVNDKGGYDGDAGEEYDSFFAELPDDWTETELEELIDTRFESSRGARVLDHVDGRTQIGAVEHETGIEFLVGIAGGLSTAAILEFAKWGWTRWKSLRSGLPIRIEPSLVVEKTTDRFPDGKVRTVERIEIRGPLDVETVERLLQQSLGDVTRGDRQI